MSCSLIKGATTLTVFVGGKPYPFDLEDEKSTRLIEMVKGGSSDEEILEFINVKNEIKSYCEDMKSEGIVITDETILIDGVEISSSLANQIRRHYEDDLPIEPLVKFVQKVRLNPSYRIRNQLWLFIEASQESGGFTIAEDGDILAYKKVRADYKDIHSGTFDNSVGKIVEMERMNVDDDPNHTCSAGLHFCAYSYLSSYGSSGNDKVMLVKVNPADVVSIPTDYNNAKARCCRYEVVQEIEHIITEPIYSDYDCGEDPTDDWSDEENTNTDVLLKNFEEVDEDTLYEFLESIDEEWRVDIISQEECLKAIEVLLKITDGAILTDWIIFMDGKKEEERNKEDNNDLEEFLENHTKNELVSFYNFIARTNYKFQNKTKWQMVEIVKTLVNELPPNKDVFVFIKAWLASNNK
jgi:hypothetical protein